MKPKVYGNPVILLDPFKITKTIFLLLILLTLNSYSQLVSLDYDGIVYQTNEIVKATANCELGFCKKKVEETKDGVVWMVIPECNEGKAQLSNQKLK